jgi:hypothetical protein
MKIERSFTTTKKEKKPQKTERSEWRAAEELATRD